jgi:hypothetical protein
VLEESDARLPVSSRWGGDSLRVRSYHGSTQILELNRRVRASNSATHLSSIRPDGGEL